MDLSLRRNNSHNEILMKVDIYELRKRLRTCLVLPHGGKLQVVPQEVLRKTGQPRFMKTEELRPGTPLIGTNAGAVQKDLDAGGYVLIPSQVQITER
jgi:uncharacterized protein YcgL (UPF0745 family)